MFVQWLLIKRKEYIYYTLYITTIFVYLFFSINRVINFVQLSLPTVLLELLDQPLVVFSFYMYIQFGLFFLNIKETYPAILKSLNILKALMLSFIACKLILIPFDISYKTSALIFAISTATIASYAIPILIKIIKKNTLLNNFLVFGALFITVGGLIGPLLGLMYKDAGEKTTAVYISIEVGLLCEFILLNIGLVYKSRQIQQEIIDTQKSLIEEYEKNKSLENSLNDIRFNISSDLHDDIGASLSSLNIYSELANGIVFNNPQKASELLKEINTQSKQTLNKMSDIVWAINSYLNSSQTLDARLKNYGSQLLSIQAIEVDYDIGNNVEILLINIQAKKNILLFIKEAMNNIAKYSKASNAKISLQIMGNYLKIFIHDNGIGFNKAHQQKGNGQLNMQKRVEDLSGIFTIESIEGTGTTIVATIPITTISDF